MKRTFFVSTISRQLSFRQGLDPHLPLTWKEGMVNPFSSFPFSAFYKLGTQTIKPYFPGSAFSGMIDFGTKGSLPPEE